MRKLFAFSLLPLAAASLAAPAAATTVTFDELGSQSSYVAYGDQLSSGGFTFRNSLPLSTSFIVWENGSADDADVDGYALNVAYPDSVTNVERTDGVKFDFFSIDLNHFTNNNPTGSGYADPFDVTFTFVDDLGISTSTVAIDAIAGFQRFTFNKTGLLSFSFTSATNSIQLDNFKYQNVATAAVPEPASWAMLIVGFGAIGGTMRRKAKLTFAA